MIIELSIVITILIGGSLFVSAAGLTGWGVPPLGYLAGVGLLIIVGFVQLPSPLPSNPALTLALTVALPAVWWIVRWRRGQAGAIPRLSMFISVSGVIGIVALTRLVSLVKFHPDSARYLIVSNLLVNETYFAGARSQLLTKRLLGFPTLHAPAHLSDADYLRSVMPLLALATLAVLVWIFQQGVRRSCTPGRMAVFAGLGILLLVTTNRFVFHAFYLNGHLLFGAFLLIVVGSSWLLITRASVPPFRLVALQVVALAAMVLTRPEGPLMGALALLPVLVCGHLAVRYRSALLVALGAPTLLWYGMTFVFFTKRDEAVPTSVYGLLALGATAIGCIGLLHWSAVARHPLVILALAEGALWLGLAGYATSQPDALKTSVQAEAHNLILGEGYWGPSMILLVGLALIAIALVRAPGERALRFPLTTFLPLAFILAYLREVPYRVSPADSMNRMIIQVVPILVLAIIVAMSSGAWRFGRARHTESTTDATHGQSSTVPQDSESVR